jgi:stage V sporulation protein S
MNPQLPSENPTKLFKVASSTDATQLAGSIQAVFDSNNLTEMTLRTIGAGSLNQAIKAVIISSRHFAKKGLSIVVLPCFNDVQTDLTAVELRVKFFKA